MKFAVRVACAALAIAGVAVVVVIVVLWREQGSDVTLPAPSGHFAVGRVTDFWRDESSPEPFATGGPTPRQLAVWIWYPAAADATDRPADYLPREWQAPFERTRGGVVARLLTRNPGRVHVHSADRAPVSPSAASYPIVVLRGGLGAQVTDYTTIAEDVASHGYIVVGFDAAYRTSRVVLPDGRMITRPPSANPETVTGDAKRQLATNLLDAWTRDVAFAVDQLEVLNRAGAGLFRGRLNVRSLAVVGHSLGGATALQFCHDDERCRAAIDIDGLPLGTVVKAGLRQPTMFLLSDHAGEDDAESARIMNDMQSIYRSANAPAWITIRGANHFSFSDQVVVRPAALVRALRIARVIRLEPRRGLAIATDCIRTFLDVHLKGAPASLLQRPSLDYAELEFGPSQQRR